MKTGSRWTVLIPLRDLGGGKTRLSASLSPDERRALTLFAVTAVVRACQQAHRVTRVVVVSGSDEASAWALGVGAEAWRQPASAKGLSNAMAAAMAAAVAPHESVALVMGDLPLATPVAIDRCLTGAERSQVTLVPSRSGAGTNLLALSPGARIELSLGATDSLARHRAAARGAKLRYQSVPAAALALDVDDATDLAMLAKRGAAREALPFLRRF